MGKIRNGERERVLGVDIELVVENTGVGKGIKVKEG